MSVKQLLYGQEYLVAKVDIIKRRFDREDDFERCVAYSRGLSQLPGCTRYICEIITSCTCLQILHIDNNDMLGAAQFILDFRGMHFNANNAFYINFKNHASVFRKAMISTISVGEVVRCYVLTTSVCDTTNNYLPMDYRYIGLIFQHLLANIINVSQLFIKLLHQPTKPHGLVGHFTNR